MDLARRAVSAAVAVARRHGVRCADPVVLHDRSNVLVHLRPAPVVARVPATVTLVRARPQRWLRADVELAGHLARAGAAVVAPSAELPPGPHHHEGVAVTFWRHVPPAEDSPADPMAVAVALATLHDAMSGYRGQLSAEGPLRDIRGGLDMMARLSMVDESVVDALRDEAARVAAELARLPVRPLHGDAHPGNLLSTPDGPVWTDFEDAWLGPLGWDLACLALAARPDGAAAVAAYPGRPDPDELAVCARARSLQVIVWGFAVARRFPSRVTEAHDRLAHWLRQNRGPARPGIPAGQRSRGGCQPGGDAPGGCQPGAYPPGGGAPGGR